MARALLRIGSAFKKLSFFYLVFGLGWTAGCIFEAALFVSMMRRGA